MSWFLDRRISERWAIVFVTACLALATGLMIGTWINHRHDEGRTPTESAPPTTPPSSEAGVGGKPHSSRAKPPTPHIGRTYRPRPTRTPTVSATPKRTPSHKPTPTRSPSSTPSLSVSPSPTPEPTDTVSPPDFPPFVPASSRVQWWPDLRPVTRTATPVVPSY